DYFKINFTQENQDNQFDIQIIEKSPEHLYIMFDKGQFEQILWNLAQNAIKYANVEPLIITLRLSLSASRRALYLDIIDNGQGIEEKKIKHIFEPFYTGGTSSSGLGLYLVRELCSANNANIVYLPSKMGEDNQVPEFSGACFRISIQAYFSQNIKPKIN
ncbi:MAG: sensor histidine kinase, partial [Ostreibacterium sp.]